MSAPEIGSGHLPGRKNPCLYLIHDGRITPLAWFVSEAAHRLWRDAYPMYRSADLVAAVEDVYPEVVA